MTDHREALNQILILCNQSRVYSRRTQQIHEVAMHGLGLTANQREERHMAIFDRVGGKPLKDDYLAREAKRKARAAELAARVIEEQVEETA